MPKVNKVGGGGRNQSSLLMPAALCRPVKKIHPHKGASSAPARGTAQTFAPPLLLQHSEQYLFNMNPELSTVCLWLGIKNKEKHGSLKGSHSPLGHTLIRSL